MKTSWHQQIIKHKNFKGEEKTIDTFWVDDDGNVDPDNLPGKRELCELLKVLKYRTDSIWVEATGVTVEDE